MSSGDISRNSNEDIRGVEDKSEIEDNQSSRIGSTHENTNQEHLQVEGTDDGKEEEYAQQVNSNEGSKRSVILEDQSSIVQVQSNADQRSQTSEESGKSDDDTDDIKSESPEEGHENSNKLFGDESSVYEYKAKKPSQESEFHLIDNESTQESMVNILN